MDHYFKGLIFASFLACALPASAFYAQATPPAGWSAGGGTGGSVTGTKTAINAMFANGGVSSPASLNTGGRSVPLPATMRFAANAPRVAAAAVMLHPGIRTAASIAGWLGLAGLVYDATSGFWQTADETSAVPVESDRIYCVSMKSIFEGNACVSSNPVVYHSNLQSALADIKARCLSNSYTPNPTCEIRADSVYLNSSSLSRSIYPASQKINCPVGWFYTSAGCAQTPPPKTVTQEEAVEELTKHPMPADAPKHIPVPLPVDTPNITPVFIPTGDPVKNPSFDPSAPPSPANPPAVQPGVEVKPAPAPGSPWQVSTTPVNRPVTDPNAPPVREPVPLPDTGGEPSENKPKDPDKTDFCEKYPTVLACQELKHEEDDTKLPEKAIDLDFNPIPGFQGLKACPSFPNLGNALGGRQISWQPFCDQLSNISNLLLALAWLYAAWILYSSRGD